MNDELKCKEFHINDDDFIADSVDAIAHIKQHFFHILAHSKLQNNNEKMSQVITNSNTHTRARRE